MRLLGTITVLGLFAVGLAAQSGSSQHTPMTFPLDCAGGDCPLLKGAPQTSGMRGGSVRLRPGESVGWHSTGEQEESLVVLHGTGSLNIDGQPDVAVHQYMLAYIPTSTRHNVTNTGTEVLEYVWIVAPIRQK